MQTEDWNFQSGTKKRKKNKAKKEGDKTNRFQVGRSSLDYTSADISESCQNANCVQKKTSNSEINQTLDSFMMLHDVLGWC
jgi:hypothetical protein